MFETELRNELAKISEFVGIFDTVDFIDTEAKFALTQFSGNLLLAYFDGEFIIDPGEQDFIYVGATFLAAVDAKYMLEPIVMNVLSASKFTYDRVITDSKRIFKDLYGEDMTNENIMLLRFETTLKRPLLKNDCVIKMCEGC